MPRESRPSTSVHISMSCRASEARVSTGLPRRTSHMISACGCGSPVLQRQTDPSPRSWTDTVTMSGSVPIVAAYANPNRLANSRFVAVSSRAGTSICSEGTVSPSHSGPGCEIESGYPTGRELGDDLSGLRDDVPERGPVQMCLECFFLGVFLVDVEGGVLLLKNEDFERQCAGLF